MIEIQVVDPKFHLFKGNAYSGHLAARLGAWADRVGSMKDSKDLKDYEQPSYVASEIRSMASGLASDEGSESAWRGVYSIACQGGKMLGICKTNAPGKPPKIVLIVTMPKALRSEDWPSPSPVSCLIAEVAHRHKGEPVKLQAEVKELVDFYKRYGFKETGGGGSKPEMKLDVEAAGKLLGTYQIGKHWQYARPLPALPGV